MKTNVAKVTNVAKTILDQILANVGGSVFYSWGAYNLRASIVGNFPTLKMDVSGVLFTGTVAVVLNEFWDVYEIHTKGKCDDRFTCVRNEVYFDELGWVLDSIIERNPEWTDEEYSEKAMAASNLKMLEF